MTAPSATESTLVDLDKFEAELKTLDLMRTDGEELRALLREVRAHRERETSAITPVQAAVLTDALRYPENGALSCRWCKADRLEAHDAHCWYLNQVKKVDAARLLVGELLLSDRAPQPEPAATAEGTP